MTERRQNILILLSDEHRADMMSCAGHPLARTPNLDRLAARGVRFTRAWTPSPICVPARASLATGRFVHEIGYWDNAMAYDGRVPSWMHALSKVGYRVDSIGKLHFRKQGDDTGFVEQIAPMHIHDGIGQVWGSVRDPLPECVGRSRLFDALGAGESEYNRYDLGTAGSAVDWIRRNAGGKTPWCLFVGIVAPHFPLVVPERYMDGINVDGLALPSHALPAGYQLHPWVDRLRRHQDHDAALASDDRRRLAIACYIGLTRFMDEQIGRILGALAETGAADSTLTIYSSDHGDNLGARGLWNKSLLYKEATAIPLIVAGPGVPVNQCCETNASLVDVAATVLDASGAKPDMALSGDSLIAMANDGENPLRVGFSEYHAVGSPSAAYMLVNGQYKFHHYVGYEPELFDLSADPHEYVNLAAEPGARIVRARFERILRARLDPDGIDRLAKADQNALVTSHGGADKAMAVGALGATPVPGHLVASA